ncbi:hypothetical protein KL919_003748 [Ogataea angusta]|nr:hypothetical protein KL941_003445 [Ogataea angusta]KAG7857111.1 hypothetical protein KL919_003748 [Ogataea angusta]
MSETIGDSQSMTRSPDACAYCGIFEPNSLVKCNSCKKWFCNGKTSGAGSHIITHTVLSKHQSLSLHPDSELGDTMLECYNCGNRNIFVLGFVSAKTDSVVVILCRLPCAQSKNVEWNTANWQSLIEDRALLPWVAKPPSEEEKLEAQPITSLQITKLETKWKQDKDATIDDMEETEMEEELEPILMRYSDAFQYQRSFAPLVQYEANYDKQLKQSQSLERLTVTWSLGTNDLHLATFALQSYDTLGMKLAVGDQMILRYSGSELAEPWEQSGFIVRIPSATRETFTLELIDSKNKSVPTHLNTGFTAELVWKGTSYARMQDALKKLAVNKKSVSEHIYYALMGIDAPPVEFRVKKKKTYSIPNFAKLNASQENAIHNVLSKPLSLIQGPPGTGKTVTSATIVYQLTKLHKGQILVCAPSNIAVDHLASKLEQLGLRVLRLIAKSREDVESSVQHLSLTEQMRKHASKDLRKLLALKEKNGELSASQYKQMASLLYKEEALLMDKCQVICCTCVGAGDRRLAKRKFRTVLIDESTQASEPECLIPIVKGANQVILVGDHQQLGPVILSRKAGDAGLRQSLFERLIYLGHMPIRLEVQYRMHPCLSEFSSNVFYDGSLQNGVTAESRSRPDSTFPWPIREIPMMFWAVFGREELSASGTSYLNRTEAMNCEKIITRLLREGVDPSKIGVITPYAGQATFIVQYMEMNGLIADKARYSEVEVASVDAFQGREKDYIILSCVRANDNQLIGFLSDPRRLNVALTRARFGMAILGNPKTLSKNTMWSRLLMHFRERGCLVDGSLENLRLCNIPLSRAGQTANGEFGLASSTATGRSQSYDTNSLFSYGTGSNLSQQNMHFQDTANSLWPKLGGRHEQQSVASSSAASSRRSSFISVENDEIRKLARQFRGQIRF